MSVRVRQLSKFLLSVKPVASTVCRVSFKSAVIFSLLFAVIFCAPAQAMVFINEVFINPPGSATDASREFIELMGTPNMKLDGYAVAVLNGTSYKFWYPAGDVPPLRIPEEGVSDPYAWTEESPGPEIDELFSLDGLTLGGNGLLALLIADKSPGYFEGVVPDSIWVSWMVDIPSENLGLWNGGLDDPGKLSNNGSVTFLLIRNRPGITEADPTNPAGLLWGKEINHDVFLEQYAIDDPNFGWGDQWGDGNIDKGGDNGMEGNSLDLSGLTTEGDLSDDLEIVDEVSYEDDAGWEYDTDGRHVDNGNNEPNFPRRHVHALDNPIGFSPDALTRVDYRTKGLGWVPSGDGTGEMTNGNNWQDTATEQWIRGNSVADTIMFKEHYFYDNASNPINAIQPFETNVPLWLDDVIGYDFLTDYSYEIMAGRINPLAVPFIPGDVDRDGDCDSDDIAKISAVFGDDDWIFSNSFSDAPEGDEVDPNTQTKPWDVDGTGDNGIEASDMQWVLNFQGDTTGQIVGVTYDSDTPAVTGVVLNSNAGVTCDIDTSVNIPSGRTVSTLLVGDTVEITVSGEITAGANSTAGEENGIMQYIHDVIIDTADVAKVISVEPLGSFNTTKDSLQQKQGTDGDWGMDTINGYTISFTEGLSAPDDMYKITLSVIGSGSADVSVTSAAMAKFVASTAEGVKVGHTDNNGDPASSSYPSAISISTNPADITGNGCIDLADFARISAAWASVLDGENWDEDCDIASPYDLIDTDDLAVLAENWLAGCGP